MAAEQQAGLELVVVVVLMGDVGLELHHVAVELLKVEARLRQAVLIVAKGQVEVARIAGVGGKKGKIAVGIGSRAVNA